MVGAPIDHSVEELSAIERSTFDVDDSGYLHLDAYQNTTMTVASPSRSPLQTRESMADKVTSSEHQTIDLNVLLPYIPSDDAEYVSDLVTRLSTAQSPEQQIYICDAVIASVYDEKESIELKMTAIDLVVRNYAPHYSSYLVHLDDVRSTPGNIKPSEHWTATISKARGIVEQCTQKLETVGRAWREPGLMEHYGFKRMGHAALIKLARCARRYPQWDAFVVRANAVVTYRLTVESATSHENRKVPYDLNPLRPADIRLIADNDDVFDTLSKMQTYTILESETTNTDTSARLQKDKYGLLVRKELFSQDLPREHIRIRRVAPDISAIGRQPQRQLPSRRVVRLANETVSKQAALGESQAPRSRPKSELDISLIFEHFRCAGCQDHVSNVTLSALVSAVIKTIAMASAVRTTGHWSVIDISILTAPSRDFMQEQQTSTTAVGMCAIHKNLEDVVRNIAVCETIADFLAAAANASAILVGSESA